MSSSPSIPLRTAYLCLDCQLINQGTRQGACHSCGSDNVYPVGTLLAAYVKPESPLQRPPRQPVRLAMLGLELHLHQKDPSAD